MSPGDLITGPSQIEWDEYLLFGDGTALNVTNLTGWDDTPAVDSGNVTRASRHGSLPGRVLAQERVVTVEFDVVPDLYDTGELLHIIRSATGFSVDGSESPLVVRADNGAPLLAYGQVHRRSLPMSPGYRRRAVGCAIQWVCSDPRRYSLGVDSVTVVPAEGGSGFTYPIVYPIDYGTPGSPGVGTAVNAGEAPSSPTLTITGPVTTPRVVNAATGDRLEFALTLGAGDTLTVDCNEGTVLLGGTGNRIYTLTSLSVPVDAFVVLPGINPLSYSGASFPAAGSTLTAAWRSASW